MSVSDGKRDRGDGHARAPNGSVQAPFVHRVFSRALYGGNVLGVVLLVVSFTIYAMEWMPALVPVALLPEYLTMDLDTYLLATGVRTGWAWTSYLRYADYLNFIGISVLAGVCIACYVAILPTFYKTRDRIYSALVVIQIVIFTLAATGLVGGGH